MGQGDGLSKTLFVVPCTRKKAKSVENVEFGPRITESLPTDLAKRLNCARRANRGPARLNEQILVPAWKRYQGRFYRAASAALERVEKKGLHLLILSGGYGVVLAGEPIGFYDAPLMLCRWPGRVLEEVLAGYFRHHRLKCMRAFIPVDCGYKPYRELVEGVDWRAAGVDNAVLFTPDDGNQSGEVFSAIILGSEGQRGQFWCARVLQ